MKQIAFFLLLLIVVSAGFADMGPKPSLDLKITYENNEINPDSTEPVLLGYVCYNVFMAGFNEGIALEKGTDYERQPTVKIDPSAMNGEIYRKIANNEYKYCDSFTSSDQHHWFYSITKNISIVYPLIMEKSNSTFKNIALLTNDTKEYEISNPAGFIGYYAINLKSDGTAEINNNPQDMMASMGSYALGSTLVKAVIMTMLIETAVIYSFLKKKATAKRIIAGGLLINFLTCLALWIINSFIPLGIISLIIAEIAIIFAEAWMINALFGLKSYKESIKISATANITSIIVGIILILFGLL